MNSQNTKLTITPAIRRAVDVLLHGAQHVFLTGAAGTGKSTLARLYIQYARKAGLNVAVTAPTATAALNLGGVTLHSLFRFGFRLSLERNLPDYLTPSSLKHYAEYKADSSSFMPPKGFGQIEQLNRMDVLVIDEVSMLRADLLDLIDRTLRSARANTLPFGGVRLLLVGDLLQLPPVLVNTRYKDGNLFSEAEQYKSLGYDHRYFFAAKVWAQASVEQLHLTDVFRQQDADFLELLGAFRTGQVGPNHFARLNANIGTLPDPTDLVRLKCIIVSGRNDDATQVNSLGMAALKGHSRTYYAVTSGEFTSRNPSLWPAEKELTLKPGARVVFIRNNGCHWHNGSLGTVLDCGELSVTVRIDCGREEEVSPETWQEYAYQFNPRTREVEKKLVGTLVQLPLRLGWATSIHKSQGQTFDRMGLYLPRPCFEHGQLYTALSRCRTREGLMLFSQVCKRSVLVDPVVLQWLSQHAQAKATPPNLAQAAIRSLPILTN
jgi:hypothetical protein